MALKDPPSYVGLDPALIYGVHDLQQKTYQRLLQLIGWMWVTRKTGNPLGTSITELAERWRIAERTAYHALQTLAEKDYIGVTYAHNRVYITKGERCSHYNTPGEPAHTQQVAGGDEQHAGGAGTQQAAHTQQAEEVSAQQARGAGDTDGPQDADHNRPGEPVQEFSQSEFNAEQLHGPNSSGVVVVGSDSRSESRSLQPQQPTNKSAVQVLMESAGMFEDKAAELAQDPWVTDERVKDWYIVLENDDAVRSVPAVLYSNLKAHREPARPKENEHYWSAFVRKQNRKRALERSGICPKCSTRPCMCEEWAAESVTAKEEPA